MSRRRMMLLCAASVTWLLAGCTDDRSAPTSVDDTTSSVLTRLTAAGFDTTGVRDMGDYVVVEGDIRIAKATINAWWLPSDSLYYGTPSFQWRSFNTVGIAAVREMKVDLYGVGLVWREATQAAMTLWNGIDAEITFVEGLPADITLYADYDLDLCAEAAYPDGGAPGVSIVINLNPAIAS